MSRRRRRRRCRHRQPTGRRRTADRCSSRACCRWRRPPLASCRGTSSRVRSRRARRRLRRDDRVAARSTLASPVTVSIMVTSEPVGTASISPARAAAPWATPTPDMSLKTTSFVQRSSPVTRSTPRSPGGDVEVPVSAVGDDHGVLGVSEDALSGIQSPTFFTGVGVDRDDERCAFDVGEQRW